MRFLSILTLRNWRGEREWLEGSGWKGGGEGRGSPNLSTNEGRAINKN